MQANAIPTLTERVVAAATYATTGLAGFIWIIYSAITKRVIRPFLMYHILLSVFLSITYWILLNLLMLIGNILAWIPFIRNIVSKIFLLLNLNVLYNLSILQLITTSILLYLMITAFAGRYSYLPWFSDIIKNFFRR